MRQSQDFAAHFELANYDTPESVRDTFCRNYAEMWVLEQHGSTNSQKMAGVRIVPDTDCITKCEDVTEIFD